MFLALMRARLTSLLVDAFGRVYQTRRTKRSDVDVCAKVGLTCNIYCCSLLHVSCQNSGTV